MDSLLTPSSTCSSEPTSPTAVSVIRKINQKNLTIDTTTTQIIPLASTIPTMLTPPFTGTSSSSCDADDDCSDGDIDVVHDSPSPKKMRPNILPVNSSYQSTLFNALLLSRQIPFDFSSQIQNIMSVSEEDDELNESGMMDNFSNGERRRGRPRKPDVVEGEDGKIIAKRMYARQYRENVGLILKILRNLGLRSRPQAYALGFRPRLKVLGLCLSLRLRPMP